MCILSFQPITGSPGAHVHIVVTARSVETGALYSKQFLDFAELEPVLVNALHPPAGQLDAVRNNLSAGKPCEWGGVTGVPYHVGRNVIEKLGLAEIPDRK